MLPLLSIITGPVGKGLALAVLAGGLFLGGVLAVREHDAKVLLQEQASEQGARIVSMNEDQKRTVKALEDEATRAANLQSSLTSARASINAAPRVKGCTSSAAVAAALGGLRSKSTASH